MKTTLLGAFMAVGMSANAILIDDFSQPSPSQTVQVSFSGLGYGEDSSLLSGLAGVLGGSRKMVVGVEGLAPWESWAGATVQNGHFQYESGLTVDSVYTVSWDANGAGLGLDLTGMTAFTFDWAQSDFPSTVSALMVSSAGNYYIQSISASTVSLRTIQLPISGFTAVGSPDLAHIDALALVLDPITGGNTYVDNVALDGAAVRVPDSPVGWLGWICVLGLLGLHAALNSTRKKWLHWQGRSSPSQAQINA